MSFIRRLNNMKKSRIIIPALAMIAFSVAASVTGAVAWFTASRTAQITAGSYSVVKLGAELKAECSAGAGTSLDPNDTKKQTILFDGVLTDGSFNHKTSNIYYPDQEGTHLGGEIPLVKEGRTAAQFVEALTRGTTSTNKTVYTAVTFDISFTVTFGSDGADIGLYLDNTANKSSFKVSDNSAAVTAKGFRMAIVPKTIPTGSYGRATVFADLQDDGDCHYISSSSDNLTPGTDYVSTDYDLIDADYNTALPRIADDTSGTLTRTQQTSRPDYLGYFKFASGTTCTLVYTVVAWFEGTDPMIVNRSVAAEYQTVTSQLNFEGLNLKPAA